MKEFLVHCTRVAFGKPLILQETCTAWPSMASVLFGGVRIVGQGATTEGNNLKFNFSENSHRRSGQITQSVSNHDHKRTYPQIGKFGR